MEVEGRAINKQIPPPLADVAAASAALPIKGRERPSFPLGKPREPLPLVVAQLRAQPGRRLRERQLGLLQVE